jgi:hypothetical protein
MRFRCTSLYVFRSAIFLHAVPRHLLVCFSICNLPPCGSALPPCMFFDLQSSSMRFRRTSSCVFRSALLFRAVLPHLLVCFSICPPLPGCFAVPPRLFGIALLLFRAVLPSLLGCLASHSSSSGLFCRTSSWVFRSALLFRAVLPRLRSSSALPVSLELRFSLLAPCLSRWSSVE